MTQGGLYALRGLADLGRTAPYIVGNLTCIVYTEPDGRIYHLTFVNSSWQSEEVLSNAPNAPLAGGDAAAVGVGNEEIIVYRGRDSHVHALSRTVGSAVPWTHTGLRC